MKRHVTFFLFSFLIFSKIQSQSEVLFLDNPSFEYESAAGVVRGEMPKSFSDCGFRSVGAKAKDLPLRFSRLQLPSHGETYLGLTVNDDRTWERAGFQLSSPMVPEQSYVFHLDMSRAESFVGASRLRGTQVNYDQACKLRIWAGHAPCDRAELLAESGLVGNFYWQNYAFVLSPSEAFSHLILEAFYETSLSFPYNGNILLDNATALVPIQYPAEMAERGEGLSRRYVFVDSIFGDEVQISFYEKADSTANKVAASVFARGHEVEQGLRQGMATMEAAEWSRFRPNKDFRDVLLFALSARGQTKGYFDVGRQIDLTDKWAATVAQLERLPNEQEIKGILEDTGMRNVGMRRDSIFWLKNKNVRFEFEGLAKAHAMDEMEKVFPQFDRMMYTMKSSEMAISKMEEQLFERFYFEGDTLLSEMVPIHQSAIVSTMAGDLLFEFEGEKYFGFINPMRGRPVKERRSVTVEAKDCKTAYAWSQTLVASLDSEVTNASKAYVLRKWISTYLGRESN